MINSQLKIDPKRKFLYVKLNETTYDTHEEREEFRKAENYYLSLISLGVDHFPSLKHFLP